MLISRVGVKLAGLLRNVLRFLTLAVWSLPTLAIAAEFSSEIEEQPLRNAAFSGGIQTDYVVQVLLSLLLVVCIIVLLSFLLKKVNFQARSASGAVRILSMVPLGSKDKLLLVAVGEEQLLIGSSPGRVQKLHTLSKPIDPAASSPQGSEDTSFMSVLNAVKRGKQQ